MLNKLKSSSISDQTTSCVLLKGVFAKTASAYHALGKHSVKSAFITALRLLEMNIVSSAFLNDVLVLVVCVFPLVVAFPLVKTAAPVLSVTDYAFISHNRNIPFQECKKARGQSLYIRQLHPCLLHCSIFFNIATILRYRLLVGVQSKTIYRPAFAI